MEHFIRVLELVDATLTEVIVGNTTILEVNLGGNDLTARQAAGLEGSGGEEVDTDDTEDDGQGDDDGAVRDQEAQPPSPTTTPAAAAAATLVVAAAAPASSSSPSSPSKRRWRDARAFALTQKREAAATAAAAVAALAEAREVTDRLFELLSEPARRGRRAAARAMRTQKREDGEGDRQAAAAAADQRRAFQGAWWANRARLHVSASQKASSFPSIIDGSAAIALLFWTVRSLLLTVMSALRMRCTPFYCIRFDESRRSSSRPGRGRRRAAPGTT